MNRMNLGCGPDIKDGWVNVDSKYDPENPDRPCWDMRGGPLAQWVGEFDYVLVNHVFCTMSYDDVDISIKNILELLKPGGRLEVIDMDAYKAYNCWINRDISGLPGFGDNIDEAFCKHLIGYGRKSLYVPALMIEKLRSAGFEHVRYIENSEYDIRPKESLVVIGEKCIDSESFHALT